MSKAVLKKKPGSKRTRCCGYPASDRYGKVVISGIRLFPSHSPSMSKTMGADLPEILWSKVMQPQIRQLGPHERMVQYMNVGGCDLGVAHREEILSASK